MNVCFFLTLRLGSSFCPGHSNASFYFHVPQTPFTVPFSVEGRNAAFARLLKCLRRATKITRVPRHRRDPNAPRPTFRVRRVHVAAKRHFRLARNSRNALMDFPFPLLLLHSLPPCTFQLSKGILLPSNFFSTSFLLRTCARIPQTLSLKSFLPSLFPTKVFPF